MGDMNVKVGCDEIGEIVGKWECLKYMRKYIILFVVFAKKDLFLADTFYFLA